MTAVSICVPVFNAEPFIGAALDSVLAQTHQDFEVVVVDNCSTDRTWEVLEAYAARDERIRLLRNESNLGAVPNWNRALDECRHDFVKLLCADDSIMLTCLERQLGAFDEGVAMVCAQRSIVDESGKVVVRARGLSGMSGRVDGRKAIRGMVQSGTNPFGEPAAVMLRRDAARAAGPFRADFGYMIDVDMWARVLAHGDLVAIHEPLAEFRLARTSWSRQAAKRQRAEATAFLKAVQQQHPDVVSKADLAIGVMRAALLNAVRRVAYFVMERR
jgi:glycosyltransferase involved in cell wall biosynthesis